MAGHDPPAGPPRPELARLGILQTEVVQTSIRLAEVGPAWDALWQRAGQNVFQSHGWVSAWWTTRQVEDQSRLCVGLCWAGGRPGCRNALHDAPAPRRTRARMGCEGLQRLLRRTRRARPSRGLASACPGLGCGGGDWRLRPSLSQPRAARRCTARPARPATASPAAQARPPVSHKPTGPPSWTRRTGLVPRSRRRGAKQPCTRNACLRRNGPGQVRAIQTRRCRR